MSGQRTYLSFWDTSVPNDEVRTLQARLSVKCAEVETLQTIITQQEDDAEAKKQSYQKYVEEAERHTSELLQQIVGLHHQTQDLQSANTSLSHQLNSLHAALADNADKGKQLVQDHKELEARCQGLEQCCQRAMSLIQRLRIRLGHYQGAEGLDSELLQEAGAFDALAEQFVVSALQRVRQRRQRQVKFSVEERAPQRKATRLGARTIPRIGESRVRSTVPGVAPLDPSHLSIGGPGVQGPRWEGPAVVEEDYYGSPSPPLLGSPQRGDHAVEGGSEESKNCGPSTAQLADEERAVLEYYGGAGMMNHSFDGGDNLQSPTLPPASEGSAADIGFAGPVELRQSTPLPHHRAMDHDEDEKFLSDLLWRNERQRSMIKDAAGAHKSLMARVAEVERLLSLRDMDLQEVKDRNEELKTNVGKLEAALSRSRMQCYALLKRRRGNAEKDQGEGVQDLVKNGTTEDQMGLDEVSAAFVSFLIARRSRACRNVHHGPSEVNHQSSCHEGSGAKYVQLRDLVGSKNESPLVTMEDVVQDFLGKDTCDQSAEALKEVAESCKVM